MATTTDPLQTPSQKSNLLDPVNHFRTVVIVALVICLLPPTVLIPVRMYVRIQIVKAFQLVDVICLLAYVFFVGLVSLSFSLLDHGEGYHAWDITLATLSGYLRQANFTEIVYKLAILFTKLVILLQLLQVFVVRKNFRYYFLYTLVWLNILLFATLTCLAIFQCWPRAKIWDATVEGHCINISVTFVVTAAINVASDVSIFILPIFWVSKLNMRGRKKVGLVLIFGTAVFACISSIMRLVVSVQDINSKDVTYTLGPVNLWSVAEISAGQILACLPFLPRLFSALVGSHPAENSRSNKGTVFTAHPATRLSNREYLEGDDVALVSGEPSAPERALIGPESGAEDVESQALWVRSGNLDLPSKALEARVEAGGAHKPTIRKTVEIRQHRSAVA